MASIKKTPSGTFQIRITNKLLPKPPWATFDTFDETDRYAKQPEGLSSQGIVPASLLERTVASREIWTIARCIAEYIRDDQVPLSERKLLDTIRPGLLTVGTGHLTYD